MREDTCVYYVTAKNEKTAVKLAWDARVEPHQLVVTTHLGDVSRYPDDIPAAAIEKFGRLFAVRIGTVIGPRGYAHPICEIQELPLPEERAWTRRT